MGNFSGKHYAIFGGFLIAIATTVASLPSWGEAVKPMYVAGLLGQVGAFLTAMYSDKPSA